MEGWLGWPLRRHLKAAARFGLLLAVVMFLIRAYQSIFIGPIPEVTNIELFRATYTLPMAYNRWWDVPGAFLFVFVQWFVALAGAKDIVHATTSEDEKVGILALATLFSLIVNFAAAVFFSITHGLVIGSVVGLLYGLVILTWITILISVLKLLANLTSKEFWRRRWKEAKRLWAWLIAAEVQ